MLKMQHMADSKFAPHSAITILDPYACLQGTNCKQCSRGLLIVCAGKEGGGAEEATEGGDDGVLELAPHYQYISGLRLAPA